MKKKVKIILSVLIALCLIMSGCAQEPVPQESADTDFTFLLGEWYSFDDSLKSTYLIITEDTTNLFIESIIQGESVDNLTINKEACTFSSDNILSLQNGISYYQNGDYIVLDKSISIQYVRESIFEQNYVEYTQEKMTYQFNITDIFGNYISADYVEEGAEINEDLFSDILDISLDDTGSIVEIVCSRYRVTYFSTKASVNSIASNSFWFVGDYCDYTDDIFTVTATYYDVSENEFDRPAIYLESSNGDSTINGWYIQVINTPVTINDTPSQSIYPEDPVSADLLIDAYDSNELRAQDTWEGRYISVRGKVANISEDKVTLWPLYAEYITNYITCTLSDSVQHNELINISKGDIITLTGYVDGLSFWGSVYMTDCTFASNYTDDPYAQARESDRATREAKGYRWSYEHNLWVERDGTMDLT